MEADLLLRQIRAYTRHDPFFVFFTVLRTALVSTLVQLLLDIIIFSLEKYEIFAKYGISLSSPEKTLYPRLEKICNMARIARFMRLSLGRFLMKKHSVS